MAILTKPTTISKGLSSNFSLNKTDLSAHAAITEAYFQDESNWKAISIEYKNAHEQTKRVIFNASVASPERSIFFSNKVRSDYQLQAITIYDNDGGSFRIGRSELGLTSSLDSAMDIAFVPPFSAVRTGNTIVSNWQPIPGATGYQFNIFRVSDNLQVVGQTLGSGVITHTDGFPVISGSSSYRVELTGIGTSTTYVSGTLAP